jgi:outer membrane protein TolC
MKFKFLSIVLYNKRLNSILSIVLVLILSFSSVSAITTLTIEDVRIKALEFNRAYLTAQEEVKKAESEVTIARSNGLPEIMLDGYYNRNIELPTFFFNTADNETIEFTSGFKNDFGASISLTQSLWSGNRVWNAIKVAKLYKKLALATYDQVKAEVIHNAEILFYSAILNRSTLDVIRKEFEASSHNLEVVEKYHNQGMVSDFELLRARVEKANLQPQILKAESEVRLADKRLNSYLGLNLETKLILIEASDDTKIILLPNESQLVDSALATRPEMHQADLTTEISKRAVSIVKADYWPKLEAVSSYNWTAQSDRMTLSDNQVTSWTAGINISFPLFRGGKTRGNVKNYKAEHRKAILAQNEVIDQIKLEVEATYDRMIQAKKTLEIQEETIQQAEEGFKIANLRYESGVGTQLEVLSAQAALTEARHAMSQAKFLLRQAKSELKKVTTIEIN